MKCQYCAGDLSIENAFCPHCGKQNPFYAAHREDMARYERQFNYTKENTIKKNERDTRKAVRITIVAVLSALILASIIVLIFMDDINDKIESNKNKRNLDSIMATLSEMEEQQDYLNMHIYYDRVYDGLRRTEITEFSEVDTMTAYYATLVNRVASMTTNEFYGDSTELAKTFSNSFKYMFDILDRADKNPSAERFSAKHMESINNIMEDACIIVEKYLGIPRDLIMETRDYTDTQRQLLFEEYVEKVTADEE